MAIVLKPKRSEISIFGEKDAYFIYENILLVCESDRKAYGDEIILYDASTKVNASVPFCFEYKDYDVKMQNPQDNVFYFSADTIKQGTKRKHSKIVMKWYKHLRNAFAHNYIRKENGVYVFEDYYDEEISPNNQTKKKTRRVLYARILSLDDFKNLIKEVKSNLK